jgi:hypothetical protein
MLSFGLGMANSRGVVHRRREEELCEAVDLLRVHIEAMERLDDDETPTSLLDFAVELGDLLHDPDNHESVMLAIRMRREHLRSPVPTPPHISDEVDEIHADYQWALKARPDIATAFIQCIFTGILSFERRWPECAGHFGRHLTNLVTSPVAEAQRIVRQAKESRPVNSMPPIGAVPA